MLSALTRYAEFHGRSDRWEFWTFLLFAGLLWIAAGVITGLLHAASAMSGSGFAVFWLVLNLLPLLFVIVPLTAVTSRRLHDLGASAVWSLLGAPYVALALTQIVVSRLQSLRLIGPLSPSYQAVEADFAVFAYATGAILLIMMLIPGTDGPNRFDPEPTTDAPRRVRLSDAAAPPHKPVFDFGPGPHSPARSSNDRKGDR